MKTVSALSFSQVKQRQRQDSRCILYYLLLYTVLRCYLESIALYMIVTYNKDPKPTLVYFEINLFYKYFVKYIYRRINLKF